MTKTELKILNDLQLNNGKFFYTYGSVKKYKGNKNYFYGLRIKNAVLKLVKLKLVTAKIGEGLIEVILNKAV